MPFYKIRARKDGFEVLENGNWLGTFGTQAEAEKEVAERQAFHRSRRHGDVEKE